jgi:putative pyoverdin transport system ATP-binding/permease protein
MKIIVFFFQHSRKIVLFSVIAGICCGICNAALLAVINATVKRNGGSSALVWSFVGLCILLPMTRFASEFLLTRLGQGAMYDLRMQLCQQILAAPLRHLEQLGVSRLTAALTDDIPTLTAAVLTIPLLCVNLSLVIGCLAYMGILSLTLLAIVLGFMVLGIATYQIPILKVQRIFSLARKDGDVLLGHFRALTQGTKELKIHSGRRQAFMNEGLKATADSLQRYNTSGQNLYSAAASWGQALVFVVIGLLLFMLPQVRHVDSTMMMAYALTLLYLMTPLQVTLNTLPQLGRANVALRNTKELGFTLSSQGSEEVTETDLIPGEWQRLELRSVVHTYHREDESDEFVLGPIDLSFTPGELVFIVGGNGSGKTTLVKLLIGLYMPEKGQIMLDGKPIEDANKEIYRQHFSAVFSDFYLFEQMFGLVNPRLDTQAREYLVQFKLSHKVEITDGKLSTTELSSGQRKRLALLTAYLEDRAIYVFDEWAADQDPYFKSVFYLQLLPELKARGKTVLVVSHDDRYYHVADRIIKLSDGQVISDGLNATKPGKLEAAGLRPA